MAKGIKRSSDDAVHHSTTNKKSKISSTPTQTCLEKLPNEIIIDIFQYLDLNDIYSGFFALNDRFEHLLTYLNIPFQIDLSRISKSNFDLYKRNVFERNKHRMKILRLSNPFTVDEILSPVRLICRLTQLEKLILDGIHSKYLPNILKHLINLPKLHSLILSPVDSITNPSVFFMEIFRLKQLKSCQFTYRIRENENILPIDIDQDETSSIEYLTINGPVLCESLQNLFVYLPKLRHLSINSLLGSTIEFSPIELKHLKSVSFDLGSISFDQFKELIENFFGSIEILRFTTSNNYSYSRDKRWEELISSSLPNLRVFDMQINYSGVLSKFLYTCSSSGFDSKFWREKQWFFHHLKDCDTSSPRGRFYSTDPYRRKDQTFIWHSEHHLGRSIRDHEFTSVKHLTIYGKRAMNNSLISFPNVTELTVKDYGRLYSGSMLTAVDHILPLQQLQKLNIDCVDFPVDQLLNLLNLTPNLRSLKWNFQSVEYTQLKAIEQSELYRTVSKANQIEHLQIIYSCWYFEIQFFIHLFPRIKSLQTGVMRGGFLPVIRSILTELDQLFYLHITGIIRAYVKRIDSLIQSEHLLDNDYLIKFVEQDIYLWW